MTIKRYTDWGHHDDVGDGSSFAACCGSRYYDKPGLLRIKNPKGIALFPTKAHFSGRNLRSKHNVHHVETKDGVITVVVKETW